MNTARIILILFAVYSFNSEAQEKYEREFKINVEKIPRAANDFIDSIKTNSKIKWYQEISHDSISYEAKFKRNNKKFSVEFDTLGILQDLEIEIKKGEISPKVLTNIERELDSIYQKWKFQKIQIQYSGESSKIVSFVTKNKPSTAVQTAYEIVLKGKNISGTHLYEVSFNEKGELKQILKITQDKATHLEY